MILSFGPELTWLYAYLTCDAKTVKSAKLNLTLAGREQTITDESFPFEFSLPLKPNDHLDLRLTFETKTLSDRVEKSEPLQLGESSPE